ncbi:hypothetical protein [Salinigranum marinum]|uniref:hypothetical protein n=1 Tax=Salinigranum marinum TaxID=1515595 RepID=UPI002989D575|nr:hypothetical protein [Salinigranum marinum]
MSQRAEYRFVPWLRRGFIPSTTDPLDGPIADPSQFAVRLTPEAERNGTTSPETPETVDIRMYGPGDVLGFDHRQVVRTEPEPQTPEFTPNYFPMVEFDTPTLPWLFSPAKATAEGKLRPWMTLVVVREQDGVSLTTGTRRETPVLEIAGDADPAAELPDLSESWAWAHVQVVGDPSSGATEATWLTDELARDSVRTLSRLVAPRRLQPDTSYLACVVPTFEPGRRAGLGLEPYPNTGDDETETGSVTPAWEIDAAPSSIQLPVYFSWRFSTGPAGDFEALVRRLDAEQLTSVGFRDIDATDPGPPELFDYSPTDVRVEGALRAIGLDQVPYPSQNRSDLAGILGQVDESATPPTFGPPVYGERHAGVPLPSVDARTDAGAVPWLRELNVDPRHRIAGGYGTQVVQHEQEALMRSAWEQVGDVRRANELLARAQLARAASAGIHDDLTALSPADLLTVTGPMHARVSDEETVHATVEASRVPRGVLSLSFRRLSRPGGPLGKRLRRAAGGTNPLAPASVLETFDRPDDHPGGPFLVESESPPNGTVVIEPGTKRRPEVTELCTALGDAISKSGGPWPPAWAPELEGRDLRQRLNGWCATAARSREQLHAALKQHDTDSLDKRYQAVFDRLRDAHRCLCEDGLETLEAALDESDPRGEVAALARLIECYRDYETALSDLDYLLTLTEMQEQEPVGEAFEALEEVLSELATLLRRRALTHLDEDFCQVSLDRFRAVEERPDIKEARLTALRNVCRLLCGDEESGTPGLVAELLVWVRSSGSSAHRLSSVLFRELVRILTVVADLLSRLEASVETSADDGETRNVVRALRSICADLELLVTFLTAVIGAPEDPVAARHRSIVCDPRPPFPSARPDARLGDPTLVEPLSPLADLVSGATDPEMTVTARVAGRINAVDPDRTDGDPLDVIMAAPEFPQPMYESLRDLDVEHFLPGVADVPPDSIGLLETNPEFVAAHLVGLNHEMARELNWREYPTDRRGTYFKRFWDRRGAVPPKTGSDLDDIDDIHTWGIGDDATALGDDLLGGGETSDAVVLLRGELLRRYPNTIVYAVGAEMVDGTRTPLLSPDSPTPEPGTQGVRYPVFRGTIDPDITFLGFDRTAEQFRDGDEDASAGYFIVIEEPPGEPRLGLDTVVENGHEDGPFAWDDLTWTDVAPGGDPDALSYVPVPATGPPGVDSPPMTPFEWGKNGAHMAGITWQQPFRIAFHATDLLPEDT